MKIIILTIPLLLSFSLCKPTTQDTKESSWTLIQSNKDSIILNYKPTPRTINEYFQNKPDCFTNGKTKWLICGYLQNATVVLRANGKAYIRSYVHSFDGTRIVTRLNWTQANNAIKFDAIDYFIDHPSNSLLVWN